MANLLRLYHGSQGIVEQADFRFSKKYNDFGQAFYTTDSADLGREWAVNENGLGFLNVYDLDMDGLRCLELLVPDFSPVQWLTALLQHRVIEKKLEEKAYLFENFLPEYRGYDIIVSQCADNSCFQYIKDFLDSALSVEEITEAMEWEDWRRQYVLLTRKALSHLAYIGAEHIASMKWLNQRNSRDLQIRLNYACLRVLRGRERGLYLRDMMRKNMTFQEFHEVIEHV